MKVIEVLTNSFLSSSGLVSIKFTNSYSVINKRQKILLGEREKSDTTQKCTTSNSHLEH